MDFKRALIRALKGTFCKSIGRLLEAKRACIGFELYENNLQTSINKGISWVLPKYGVINSKSYIIGTRSHGGDGGKRNVTEVPTAQRATEV